MRAVRWVAFAVLVSLLVFPSVASAQAAPKGVETYIPDGPVLYVHYQGFAQAKTTFEGTALKKILSDPEFQEFGEELSRFLDALLRQNARQFPFTWQEIRTLLDCELAYALIDPRENPPQMMVVVRAGEHVEKIRALADKLIRLAIPPDQPVPEEEMDGVRYKAVGPLSLCWVGGDLVVTLGPGTMRKAVRVMKGLDNSLAQNERFRKICTRARSDKAFLLAHVDVDALVKMTLGDADQETPVWFRALGVKSLSAAHLSITPDAPGIRSALYLHVPRGPEGVFRMLPTEPIDEKKMLARIGDKSPAFLVMRCNLAKMYDEWERVITAGGGDRGFQRAMAEVKDWAGFDLRTDLLAALGDEIAIDTVGPGLFILPEFIATFGVKDAGTVQRCLERLVEATGREFDRGGRSAMTVEKYVYRGREIVVNRIAAAPLPLAPSFTLGNGELAVALVPQTLKKLIARGDAPARSIVNNADFATVRPHVAAKPVLLTYSEFKTGFEALYGGIMTHMVQMLNGAPMLPANDLATKFPSTNAIVPHLFGSIVSFSRDDEGFLLESYGTFGGGVLPGGDISGVGVMAGFLLPALSKSQEAARRAACMNNTRQIGLAMAMYAADNDGEYPKEMSVLLQKGYLGTPKVFLCPSSRNAIPPGLFAGDPKKITEEELARFNSYVMVPGAKHNWPASAMIVYDKD
ncbi:MAG TPA: DUF1559 domain-containing protein, partial [Planctomycetota bacterium]|nr:DUF1559 domain-containing protein [Planctomycetota bacterium]